MNNLTYNIVEKTNNIPINIHDLQAEYENINISNNFPICSGDLNKIASMEMDYEINYTIKDLKCILDYYNINKNKLKKNEIIQLLIIFEEEPENQVIVYRRKQLWHYVKELKHDTYFKKYIIFDPPNN
jgi:hypothetical protein